MNEVEKVEVRDCNARAEVTGPVSLLVLTQN